MTEEDRLQISIVEYIRLQYPRLVFFAVPNGGFRHVREAAKLKRMGVLAGVSDLVFCLPDGRFAAIELKTAKGSASDLQNAFLASLPPETPKAFCRSLEAVVAVLKEWGVRR